MLLFVIGSIFGSSFGLVSVGSSVWGFGSTFRSLYTSSECDLLAGEGLLGLFLLTGDGERLEFWWAAREG